MDIYAHKVKNLVLILGVLSLAACANTQPTRNNTNIRNPQINAVGTALPDNVHFLQTDKRWAQQTLGGSFESLKSDGCLVTATAMALANLGFRTDPGDLTNRLKSVGGFTRQGWLVWSGVERATGGVAKTYFYKRKDDEIVRSCLRAGYYPLVKFDLASKRTHWAVVVNETKDGFYIRDPMVKSKDPILLTSRARGIDAVRCLGVPAKA